MVVRTERASCESGDPECDRGSGGGGREAKAVRESLRFQIRVSGSLI